MNRFKYFIVLFFLFTFISQTFSQGNLVIIGGGKRPDYIMQEIVKLAGGEKSQIVIIPAASGKPLDAALYQRYQFEKVGAKQVRFVEFPTENVDAPENLKILDGATGIFFSGGDQRRLQKALLGTKLLQRIREIYQQGGVISGSSAGAAIMSKVMITGDELINPDSTRKFIAIQKGNVDTKEGFAFIEHAIIDQHFIKRSRHNRLISLALENPNLLGIGIDESTAIVVNAEKKFRVLGESTVIIYDASQAANINTNKKQYFSANNIKVHLLQSGQWFDLKQKKVIND